MFNDFIPFLPMKTKEIISPFFGGGCIELNLALRGIRVYGGDIYVPIVNFWQHWLKNPESVVNAAIDVLELYSRTELKMLGMKEDVSLISQDVFGAGLFLLLNQLSFSGQERDSHIYDYKLRLSDGEWVQFADKNVELGKPIFRNRDFWVNHKELSVNVELIDAFDLLDKYPNHFAFLDPPYPDVRGYYGKNKKYHEHFDHERLRDILTDRDEWVLTYNDVPYVRELYQDYRFVSCKRNTGMQGNRNEVMIMPYDMEQDQLSLF